ncbi:phosphotransferase family protein [Nocardioides sp. GY 10113]|uniref:phosphotransferase family protein n=1 Tax=Nocardioides sp. GY 10113 TaxID=2569761 RepID=UPI0010A7EF55|nr:phosphotransferase family protein [Nocardioides sp. GY 10113]TIC88421.1 phosphotransferase family protein [Nocardioides sp. GY 10113]
MTTEILGADELAAVATVMAQAGTTPEGPLTARVIAGGKSNLTLRLSDGVRDWVMRTPPRAGRTPSAHDVVREYRVVSALGPTEVPVAPTVVAYPEEDLIGGAFAICDYVAGANVQSREDLARLSDAQVDAAMSALLGALAALHQIDHVAAGLETFGRPDGYAARQLKRWSGQWDIVGQHQSAATRAAAAELAARLGRRLPEQRATGIVHGDFRMDNTLLRLDAEHPEHVEVAAVVDWELSTIGDPVADVAMMCVYRHPSFDLVAGGPCAWTSDRLPSVDGFATAYLKAGGVELHDFEQHLALGYYKVAVIAAGIDHRYRAGATVGDGFDAAGEAVAPLLEAGLALT